MDLIYSLTNITFGHIFWTITALVVCFWTGFVLKWCFAVRSRSAVLYYNPTSRNEDLVALCETMKCYDRVPIWGVNGHVQSIYASQVRKGPTYELQRYGLDYECTPSMQNYVF